MSVFKKLHNITCGALQSVEKQEKRAGSVRLCILSLQGECCESKTFTGTASAVRLYFRRCGMYAPGADYIEISVKRNLGKEGRLMSDFEMLSIVLMILGIVVTILIAYIDHTKKNRVSMGNCAEK